MVPEFNGGGYSPVTPNNGNPNTVYNQARADQTPVFATTGTRQLQDAMPPMFQPMPKPTGTGAAPTFASTYATQPSNQVSLDNYNNRSRSPYSLTLERPPEPTGRISTNTMYTDSLRNLLSSMSSLERPLTPIPVGGSTPTNPNPTGPTTPTNPTQPVSPGSGPNAGSEPVAPEFRPRDPVWGDPNFSFDRDMVPVRPVSGSYGPSDGLGNNFNWDAPVAGASGGSSGGTLRSLWSSLMSGLSNIGTSIRNEVTGEFDDLTGANGASRQWQSFIGAVSPVAGLAINFFRERLNEGSVPQEVVAAIQRMPPEQGAAEMLALANRTLGDEAAAAIQQSLAGRPVTAAQRAAIEATRAAAREAGFPDTIENMSPQEVRQLSNRIAEVNMLRDPNARVMLNNNYRSIAGGAGPAGMIARMRGHTTATGRVGLMDGAAEMEAEAVRQWNEYINNQTR